MDFRYAMAFLDTTASVQLGATYAGWKPDPSTALVRDVIASYETLYGKKPGVAAVHAGLECGVLKAKLPAVDAVSIGPTIVGAHSTQERVEIESVMKFYGLLRSVLQRVSG